MLIMKKMFLILLSLVIVSMFIVGCGTGQAVKVGKSTQKVPTNQEVMKAKEQGPSSKIISIYEAKYQYLMNAPKTASEVCADEGLKCGGVVHEFIVEFLGENGQVQAVNNYNSWYGTSFCDSSQLGALNSIQLPDNNQSEYLEPYAGSVRSSGRAVAVLCS